MATMVEPAVAEWTPGGRPFTRTDLVGMPDDGHRYELIDGVLIVAPAPSVRHQIVSANLYTRLRQFCPPDLRLLYAPLDVELAEDTVLQPDLLIAPHGQFAGHSLIGAPLLAVEISSPSTRHLDLAFKRSRYEAAGCDSYWVVDPLEPSVTAWHLEDGRYVDAGRAFGEEELTVDRPFPVALVPAQLVL